MSRKSARKTLHDAIGPHLPGYKLIPNQRGVDVPDHRFVQISIREMRPSPTAAGFIEVEFVVTVVTPLTTPQKAEDDLDDAVADLLRAIDQIEWADWQTAEKVVYGSRHLAYDVRVVGLAPKQ